MMSGIITWIIYDKERVGVSNLNRDCDVSVGGTDVTFWKYVPEDV